MRKPRLAAVAAMGCVAAVGGVPVRFGPDGDGGRAARQLPDSAGTGVSLGNGKDLGAISLTKS